jgi:hypothetical protein
VKVSGSVTALYGGRAEIGINYGVSWKAILKIFGRTILSIPVPYVSPYANSGSVNTNSNYILAEITDEGVAYFGTADVRLHGSLALTPAVHATIGANICRIVGLDLGIEYGLKLSGGLTFSTAYNPSTGLKFPALNVIKSVSPVKSLYLKPWVGLNVSPIGFIGYERRFEL